MAPETIVVVNEAKTPIRLPAGKTLQDVINAVQKAHDRDFAPIWGGARTLELDDQIPANSSAIVLLDDADQAGALGYHETTPNGFAMAKVFVKTTQDDGEDAVVTLTHELFEFCADRYCQLGAQGPKNVFYALEVSDAVEETFYSVDGVSISNFVTPEYFFPGGKATSKPLDFLGQVSRPFQILKGGYMAEFISGRWTQKFGSKLAARSWNPAAHTRLTIRRTPHHLRKRSHPRNAR
jgi:hypothetical protein